MKQRNASRLLLGFVKLTGILPALMFFKPKVIYKDKQRQSKKLPAPCILMSNHTSLLDFVLYICLFFGRTIRFLMAEVLFNKGKLFARFLFALGGIYVNRNQLNMGFMAECIRILDQGGTVGIFPQGRLPVNGKPFPFKSGVTYMALHTDAPIVPIYTDGNYGLFKRATVVIGTPIHLKDLCKEESPSIEEIERLTRFLEEETYRLKEYLSQNEKQ